MEQFLTRLQRKPSAGKGVFIAKNAVVVGEVHLADHVSIWYSVVARGDVAPIYIGRNSNVQDGSVLHVAEDMPVVIGENVSVGHGGNLHGCTVGNNVLVGIGAIVLNGAVIGDNSIVAAGSLVPQGKIFPPGVMIMGSPAKNIRPLTNKEIQWVAQNAANYLEYKNVYLEGERGFFEP